MKGSKWAAESVSDFWRLAWEGVAGRGWGPGSRGSARQRCQRTGVSWLLMYSSPCAGDTASLAASLSQPPIAFQELSEVHALGAHIWWPHLCALQCVPTICSPWWRFSRQRAWWEGHELPSISCTMDSLTTCGCSAGYTESDNTGQSRPLWALENINHGPLLLADDSWPHDHFQ